MQGVWDHSTFEVGKNPSCGRRMGSEENETDFLHKSPTSERLLKMGRNRQRSPSPPHSTTTGSSVTWTSECRKGEENTRRVQHVLRDTIAWNHVVGKEKDGCPGRINLHPLTSSCWFKTCWTLSTCPPKWEQMLISNFNLVVMGASPVQCEFQTTTGWYEKLGWSSNSKLANRYTDAENEELAPSLIRAVRNLWVFFLLTLSYWLQKLRFR